MPTSPTRIHSSLQAFAVPIEKLVPFKRNPNKGDVAKIKKSLARNGQFRPIMARSDTWEVLGGNHTLQAAKELGWTEIAVSFADPESEEDATRIMLADNGTRDGASYDQPLLADLLAGLPDLEGSGFEQVDLDNLIFGIEQEPAEAPESADEIPASSSERQIARPGDIFELGEHRLIVGDATEPAVLARLMGEDVGDLLWTDPPYGVEYVGKTKDALRIDNDGAAGLPALLYDSFTAARPHLRPGAPCYIAHSDTQRMAFERAFRDAGYIFRQNLIWVKNTMVLGHSDYHYQHEPILEGMAGEPEDWVPGRNHEPLLYGFTPNGDGRLGRGGPRWYGTNNRTTVFDFKKPAASAEHPTMKPVDLILAMLANSVRPGGIVLDMFAGSGSTLVAAHYHGAHARLVELDPHYADIICARYQRIDGDLPMRDGEPVDFLGGH